MWLYSNQLVVLFIIIILICIICPVSDKLLSSFHVNTHLLTNTLGDCKNILLKDRFIVRSSLEPANSIFYRDNNSMAGLLEICTLSVIFTRSIPLCYIQQSPIRLTKHKDNLTDKPLLIGCQSHENSPKHIEIVKKFPELMHLPLIIDLLPSY